ncbi:MAG: TIR domain-containing protein [Blastocatellales bacterium]
MNKERKNPTRLSSRRIFVLIGVLLLLLAAAGLAIAYSRASARKSVEDGQINRQALITPTPAPKPSPAASPDAAPSPTPTPIVIPKPVTVCFNDGLDLRASAKEVFQGAMVTFSTSGVKGGSNYGPVKYQWKSSGGKLISNGLRASLDTSEFTTQTTISVSIEAVSNDGVCRASSEAKVIRIHPQYKPPVISLEPGEVKRGDPALDANSTGAICAGDHVNLRVNTAESDLKYEWQSTDGRIIGGGNSAVFDSTGLAPGFYTVSVMAEGAKGSAFDSIPLVVSDCLPETQPRRDAECFSPDISVESQYVAEGIILIAHLKGYSPQLGKVKFDWKAESGKIFGSGAIAWFDSRSVLSNAPVEISVSARSEKGDCQTNEVRVKTSKPVYAMASAAMPPASLSSCGSFRRNDATLTERCKAELRSLAAELNRRPYCRLYVDIERANGEAEGVDLLRGKSIHDHLVYVLRVNANQVIVRPGGSSGGDQAAGLEIIDAGETPPSGPPAVIFAPQETSAPPPPIGGVIKAGAGEPRLKFQEEVKGDYPSRVETEAKETISLRFVRKLVLNPTATNSSATEGERTKVTETTNQIPGRSLETPLEQAMGEGYEPWIKATLSSSTFEAAPKNAETADWRRLDASPEILWEWTITTNSKTLVQELKAEIDVEWRPIGATKGETIRHLLWEGALKIDVDNPVLKVEQVKTATPIFSIAGLASIVVGVYPRKRRKEGEEEADEDDPGFSMMAPPPAPSVERSSEPPTIIPIRAGKNDDKTNESHDLVECSVFSPPTTPRGATIMVQVFAHLEGKSADAEKMALEFDEAARRRAVKTLSARVPRETELMFHLAISNWQISEPAQTLVWMGDAESVQFIVDVPPDCKLGAAAAKVTVSQNSVPIGQISFILKVAEQAESAKEAPVPAGDDARRYKYAFVSYASADRDKVLARVQMLEQFGIEYFQDILDLDPGDRWEKELYKNIDQCDLFLLFWSQHAKDSPWVMKEVEYALARKGADENAPPEIKPVIIEGPPIIPPPEKLSGLHFNDRLIYFFSNK